MRIRTLFFRCAALVLFILGISISFWPLVALSIALSVWRGSWILAFCMALAADLFYGVPVGVLHPFILPFTFVTLTTIVLRAALLSQVRRSASSVL